MTAFAACGPVACEESSINGHVLRRLFVSLALAVVLGGFSSSQETVFSTAADAPVTPYEHRYPVVLYIADGMRVPDVKRLVAEGKMPNFGRLLEQGVDAGMGLIPVVPASSAPNWVTMSTGTSPGVHGATNNLFMDNNRRMTPFGIDGFSPSSHEGETIAEDAENRGLTVVALGWKTFDITSLRNGAGISPFPIVLTGRGVISNYDIPGVKPEVLDFADALGQKLSYTRLNLAPAGGWSSVPASFSPARQTSFEVSPRLVYDVYIYDSTNDSSVNYDKVLISPTKNGAQQVAVVTPGHWSGSISTTLAFGHGKFYVKLLDLAPDLSRFRLYFTAVTSVWAWPLSLADDLATRFDGVMKWDDFLPYWAGLIDDDTFAEQTLDWYRVMGDQMFPYIVKTYHPDLVMSGTPVPDIMQHAFLALATPGTDIYDPVLGPKARRFIELAYMGADRSLGRLVDLMGSADVFALSDHGFSATWRSICAHCLLRDAGLLNPDDLPGSQAVPYLTSGTAQIYINLEGRNPDGVVPVEQYEATRQRIVTIFQQLGPTVVERVLLKEQTKAVTTTMGVTMNMLHPDRTGDVVVFAAPPYTFGPTDALGKLYGDHGFTPNGDENRFGVFAAAGPDIVPGPFTGPLTALDIVPTAAFALGIAPPPAAEGRILPIFRRPLRFLPFVCNRSLAETEGWAGR